MIKIYLKIKKFYHLSEVKKDPAANHPWAINYKGVDYFNLWYSLDLDVNHVYVKGVKSGRMLYFVLDKKTKKL